MNKAEQLIEKLSGIDEALKPKDKKVIDSFLYKESNDAGVSLKTDGKSLTFGNRLLSKWDGDVVLITTKLLGGVEQSATKYVKKSLGSVESKSVEL